MTIPYWAEDVKRWDRDRYLCTLLAPEDRRNDLFTLYAFNTEIARVRETVSEPLLGNIRLQWWRETLEAVFDGKPPRHDLAEALGQIISRYELPRPLFDRMLDTREFDMQDRPPEDMGALMAYAEGTASSLQLLALSIQGGGESSEKAARDLGIAWALIGLIRATPFQAATGRTFLPLDMLNKENLDPLRLSPSDGLSRVVGQVAEYAVEALQSSRRLKSDVPKAARNVMLLAPLADSYLKQMSKVGFDPFHATMHSGATRRQLKLAWYSFWKNY